MKLNAKTIIIAASQGATNGIQNLFSCLQSDISVSCWLYKTFLFFGGWGLSSPLCSLLGQRQFLLFYFLEKMRLPLIPFFAVASFPKNTKKTTFQSTYWRSSRRMFLFYLKSCYECCPLFFTEVCHAVIATFFFKWLYCEDSETWIVVLFCFCWVFFYFWMRSLQGL